MVGFPDRIARPRIPPALALAFALVALPGPARGDDPVKDSAREHFQRGRAAFVRQEFVGALAEFQAAQRIKPAPGLDYNIGVCFDRLGRGDEALASYRRFLSSNPTGPEADDAAARVHALEESIIPPRPPPAAPPVPEAPPPERPVRPAQPPDEAPVAVEIAPRPEAAPPPTGGSWSLRKRAGIGLAAAGGVVAIAGGVLVIVGAVAAGKVNDVPTVGLRDDRVSAVNGERIGGGVALGVGAVALIAGLVAVALPGSHSRQTFYVAPSGSGLLVGGTF